jgi:glutamate-1-semialdehyde 2,1-aminomutase
MTAGLKNLEIISQPGFYEALTEKATKLLSGLQTIADEADVPFTTSQVGAMFGLFFTDADKVTSFAQATNCDVERFKQFFHGMLDRGVNLAPSAYEAGFISSAHSDADIEATLEAASAVFPQL